MSETTNTEEQEAMKNFLSQESIEEDALTFKWGQRLREIPEDKLQEFHQEFEEWVQWFSDTYNLKTNTILNCWAQHTDMVANLYAAYCFEWKAWSSGQEGTMPLMWEREAELTVQRLQSIVAKTKCVEKGQHTPDTKKTIDIQIWEENNE